MTRWLRHDETISIRDVGPILFLDRDGVIVQEKDYLSDPAEVELADGVATALARARRAGWRLIGVSNQSGLGRGRFDTTQFEAVMERLDELMLAAGCPLDAFFYCPHAPDAGCACRKPRLGLLEEAAAVTTWDAARSWMVGDKISDVDFGLAAGLHTALVLTGHGAAQRSDLGDRPGVLVAPDLPAVVAHILQEFEA